MMINKKIELGGNTMTRPVPQTAREFATLALIRLYVGMSLDHKDRDAIYALILKETGRTQISTAELLDAVN